jgi:CubicO group peptidase (beta-lactamase class C family)
MLLVNDNKVQLDDQVSQFVPAFRPVANTRTEIRHLLNHTSGLPAWKPYYDDVIHSEMSGRTGFIGSRAAKNYILEQVHQEASLSEPGMQAVYSDLGFMVLGEIIETISGWTPSFMSGFASRFNYVRQLFST